MIKGFICLIVLVQSLQVVAKPLIYIVKQQELPAYNLAIDAIKEERGPITSCVWLPLIARPLISVKKIKKSRPKLTISVGTKATNYCKQSSNDSRYYLPWYFGRIVLSSSKILVSW